MHTAVLSIVAALAGPVFFAVAAVASDSQIAQSAAEIRREHVEQNVPLEAYFDSILERDLIAYFARRGIKDPGVQIEALRIGPTQSGVSYPKYYFWVWVTSDGVETTSGALRAAAVDGARFDVTDYISREEIAARPQR